MRFSSYLSTAITAIGLLAANAAAVTYTWDGSASSAWSNPANWDVGSGYPDDSSDTAIIPNVATDPVLDLSVTVGGVQIQSAAVLETKQYTLTIAASSGLDVQSGAQLIVSGNGAGTPGKLDVIAGGTHLISGTGFVDLTEPNSTFKVSATGTVGFSGSAGKIIGTHESSILEVASGVLFTSDVIVQGGMDFSGSGTFRNTEAVRAINGQTMLFGSSLNLSDTAGAEWKVDSGEFEFDKAHTGNSALLGDLKLYGGGLLDFDANMEFNNGGAGTVTFTWFAGTLNIASGVTFTFEAFSSGGGACPNPDTSGGAGDPPYEVTGSYVVTCP